MHEQDAETLDWRVSADFIRRYEANEIVPTSGQWYVESWPPEPAKTVIVLGFAWNALRIETLYGRKCWIPLRLQNISISNHETRIGRNGLPEGSFTIESRDTKLYKTGEIESFTRDGEFLVRVETGELVPFRPVMYDWYYATCRDEGENDRSWVELRFVFGCGQGYWPSDHRDSLPHALSSREPLVQEVLLNPDWSYEEVPSGG